MSASAPAIDLARVSREFVVHAGLFGRDSHRIRALDDLSLGIGDGEVFGLLGPNGAGKTTLVKILTTMLVPSSGHATVLGHEVVRAAGWVRRHVGFVLGGERGLYYRLSARDNLRYFAELYGLDHRAARARIGAVLGLVGLTSRADDRVESYSRGMKQRLHIARAILHRPAVLLLDEPTLGLDPVAARDVRSLINELHRESRVILLTTHLLHEADQLCHRLAVINRGRLLAVGTPNEIRAHADGRELLELELPVITPDAVEQMRQLSAVDSVEVVSFGDGGRLRITGRDLARVLPALLHAAGPVSPTRVALRDASLEDAYLRLLGGDSA